MCLLQDRGEGPRTREHLGTGTVEADQVVPAVGDGQCVAVQPVAVGVVDGDRPEAVHGDVAADGELVLADRQVRRHAHVGGLTVRKATPARGRGDQVGDRVDVLPATEAALERRHVAGQRQEGATGAVEAVGVVGRRLERTVCPRADAELVLDRGDGRDVIGVARVDQGACGDDDVGAVELVDLQRAARPRGGPGSRSGPR